MSIGTHVGFVVRRIWARRLMLLGSFLGATLVTALLVVLPLYEASVQAVDLLFTFRQAPSAALDLNASHTQSQYTAGQAEVTREALLEAAEPLRRWYPDLEERIVSREFALIPLDVPDWLGRAAGWRDGGGHESGATPPYPTVPQEALSTRFFTAAHLESLIEIVEGEMAETAHPGNLSDPVLRVVFGEAIAANARLRVGDRIVLRPFISSPVEFEIVEVAGIARPVDPADPIWDQAAPTQTAGHLVFVTEDTFNAWTGVTTDLGDWHGAFPVADPSTDPWLRTERGFRTPASQNFFLHLDRDAVTLDNVEELAASITGFSANVARSEIRSLSRLPGIVAEFDVRTVVFGAPIVAMLALVVAGALYFLVYMAALAVEREGGELALLRMRGASAAQTTGLHLMQSVVIAAAAVLAAPFVARLLVSMTGFIPPMSTLTGGEALTVAHGRSIVPFALAGGVVAFVSMGLAILPVARRSVLELRALATRPARVSVWQRYHLDLFLIALSIVILWELSQRGIVDTGRDELGLDPFSVAAPALFLFSGALLLLRVLPWVLRAVGWLMTRVRGLTTALPGWHLGRNPIPYGRLALLVWLTTGFGAFALTYAATLDASYRDRATFASGADVRVVSTDSAVITTIDGVTVSPVFRGLGAPRLASRSSELLGVVPETFPDVVTWRSDFGAPSAAAAFGADVLGPRIEWGIRLPVGATAIQVDGVRIPEPWATRAERGAATPVRVMARLVDESGVYRIHAADAPFTDSGWRTVSIDLSGASAIGRPVPDSPGLSLQAIWLERDAPTGDTLEAGQVLVDDWRVVVPDGTVPLGDDIEATFGAHHGLTVDTAPAGLAADVFFSRVPEGQQATPLLVAASPLNRSGPDVTLWSFSSRNRAQPVPHLRSEPQPIRVVLDREAALVGGLGVGDETLFGFAGAQAPGVVAGVVDLIPTTGDPRHSGAMVMRLDALVHWASPDPSWSLRGTIARTTAPTELWVAADDPDGALRAVLAATDEEPAEVLTASGVAADFSSRPIQVGLVAILFIGTGAGVALALAGVTAYVLVAVRRRYHEMGVLRALGFRRRGVAGTFALEQMVVLGVGAVIGVAAGIGLMRLMVPFLQLGEGGREIIPSAVMTVPVTTLGLYLAAVAGLLVLSVVASTRSVSARRLSEVLREVER